MHSRGLACINCQIQPIHWRIQGGAVLGHGPPSLPRAMMLCYNNDECRQAFRIWCRDTLSIIQPIQLKHHSRYSLACAFYSERSVFSRVRQLL